MIEWFNTKCYIDNLFDVINKWIRKGSDTTGATIHQGSESNFQIPGYTKRFLQDENMEIFTLTLLYIFYFRFQILLMVYYFALAQFLEITYKSCCFPRSVYSHNVMKHLTQFLSQKVWTMVLTDKGLIGKSIKLKLWTIRDNLSLIYINLA